jgi:hypothetical protein
MGTKKDFEDCYFKETKTEKEWLVPVARELVGGWGCSDPGED